MRLVYNDVLVLYYRNEFIIQRVTMVKVWLLVERIMIGKLLLICGIMKCPAMTLTTQVPILIQAILRKLFGRILPLLGVGSVFAQISIIIFTCVNMNPVAMYLLGMAMMKIYILVQMLLKAHTLY